MCKPMLLISLPFLLIACNTSDYNKQPGNNQDTAASADTSHGHSMDMSGNVAALPGLPEGAKIYFKNLKNNATITSPVKVEFGVDNIRVDTAGPLVAGSGHHHLFVDAEDSLAAGTVIPKDSTHLHFGKGQTQIDSLKLSPGKHKLTLQFADGLHRSYGGKMATSINVNVKK